MEIRGFFQDGIFTSSDLPKVRVRINPSFRYLGSFSFDLYGVATAERHVFVDANDFHIRRMIIFQFEGYNSDNNYTYQAGTPNPIELGGDIYQHNTICFDNQKFIFEKPGTEPDHTTRFLAEKGYQTENELMMARFARIVDPQRRHELIVFYVENISSTGMTLQELSEEGGILPQHQAISAELTRRALENITFLENDQNPHKG